MSVIMLEESECIDKILVDFNEHVSSKEDYYFWANQKYQSLMGLLKNPKNSQVAYKALNFITYLDPQSGVDKTPKNEKRWDQFFDWDREEIKQSLKQEFDPEGFGRKQIYGR